jgi:glutathione S-transferase
MEIWGRATSSNVQKVLWCCSELDIAYTRYDIGREFGGNRSPDYLEMNPNGLVPTIRDGDLVIWESNTIMRYLASSYGGSALYPTAAAARAVVDQWLDWELGTLAPTIFPVFWGLIRTPVADRDETALAQATAKLVELWEILDRHLAGRDYVAGKQLSLADIAMGNSIHRWFAFPIERPRFAHLKAWHERIASTAGFREHVDKPVV